MAKKQVNRLVSTDENGDTNYIREEIEVPEETIQSEPKIDFDSWYALRSKDIPPQHHKEILKVDFNARKVTDTATMAEFDNALKKYGISLD